MPLTSSAKKALKVSKRRKTENDLARADLKNVVKGARLAIAKGGKEAAEQIQPLYRALDIATKKHLIHKNKASRLKSKISIAANKVAGQPAVVASKPVKKAKKTSK